MTLRLTYKGETTIPVELEGILPEKLTGLNRADIERLPVLLGNRRLPLAELFTVAGNGDCEQLEFEGDLSGVHWMGAGMTSGTIRAQGSVGRHAGSQMAGGRIEVRGDAGDWLGAEMHGGEIHVLGNAGDQTGAAYPGSPRGMTGGTIAVEGDARNEVGSAMRRGLIAIGGTAGELVGVNMLAGTILAMAGCGRHPGANMRRGTIVLGGVEPPELLPTFPFACRYRPAFLAILQDQLNRCGVQLDPSFAQADYDLYSGDMLESGRGELLVRV